METQVPVNDVLTITPDNIYMSEFGKNIMLLGVRSDEDIKRFQKIFDSAFPTTELAYYASTDGITEKNLTWYRTMSSIIEEVVIDIEKASSEEIIMGMSMLHDRSNAEVVWWVYGEDQTIRRLLSKQPTNKVSILIKDDDQFDRILNQMVSANDD